MERKDPLRNFKFRLESDIGQANFSEVTIGESTTDAVDYREGNEKTSHVRKLDGLTKYGNITLKWGVTDSTAMYDWHQQIVEGQIQQKGRKDVTIVVQDEAGNDKASFVVAQAWPVKYQLSGLNGKGNEVFIETMELVNEGIKRNP